MNLSNNQLKIFLILQCGLLVFASCTRQSSLSPSPLHPTSLNYVAMASGPADSFYTSGSSVSSAGASGAKIVIHAASGASASFLLALNPYAGISGLYALNGESTIEYRHTSTTDSFTRSAHGNVTISAVSPNIIGTFIFTGLDSIVYTGSFDVVAP